MFRKPDGAGKGDAPRPVNDWDKFSDNFDKIFGKKEKKDDKQRSDDANKQDENKS